jgi:hypothetical protein
VAWASSWPEGDARTEACTRTPPDAMRRRVIGPGPRSGLVAQWFNNGLSFSKKKVDSDFVMKKLVLPPSQIVSHSNNLVESKYFHV